LVKTSVINTPSATTSAGTRSQEQRKRDGQNAKQQGDFEGHGGPSPALFFAAPFRLARAL
jgi:hypothetical protein